MSDLPFPPADLGAFLQLCDGRWMSLRSLVQLDGSDDWHSSERGELVMQSAQEGADGGASLMVCAADGRQLAAMHFAPGGVLTLAASPTDQTGHWQLHGDGCLELTVPGADGASLRERIWFTKANLRLRSTTLVDQDGTPRRASFCSEIRRVTAPQG
ncbi:putative phycobilin lyase [Synechococcus sp. RS9909]|uniref:phycobiliprotein lyase n=1 Tax=unclassified Synechococcus TaxID=2626047 RepID=UPI000068FC3F|nr:MULTISPECIES: phycobiliprotein lyase [unclassified Synechococcus]EAQ68052.1 hypothetical protein RS9917_01916 [Synechococcus sp. RS9917]QNI78786.1 putative phycobilin lyase [Synechococcus sp. RS9909]